MGQPAGRAVHATANSSPDARCEGQPRVEEKGVQPTEKKRGDGLERRPLVGIAQERETSADDAAPDQRECRTLSDTRLTRPFAGLATATCSPSRPCYCDMFARPIRLVRHVPIQPAPLLRHVPPADPASATCSRPTGPATATCSPRRSRYCDMFPPSRTRYCDMFPPPIPLVRHVPAADPASATCSRPAGPATATCSPSPIRLVRHVPAQPDPLLRHVPAQPDPLLRHVPPADPATATCSRRRSR